LLELHPFELDTAAIGGLLGTPRDFIGLVDEMLRDEDGMLQATSKRAMLSVQAKGAAGIVSREGVGLGWKYGLADGTAFWNHEGGGPGFCSETRLYPEAKMGMVVMMNRSQNSGLSRLCHQICERIRSEHAAG
jgi:CubicO group peptidase (beta-lactamase class C family)